MGDWPEDPEEVNCEEEELEEVPHQEDDTLRQPTPPKEEPTTHFPGDDVLFLDLPQCCPWPIGGMLEGSKNRLACPGCSDSSDLTNGCPPPLHHLSKDPIARAVRCKETYDRCLVARNVFVLQGSFVWMLLCSSAVARLVCLMANRPNSSAKAW